MISRKHRFHGHGSLNYLFRKGKIVRSDALALRYAHSRGEDYKLAVVVSKKVSKAAVTRNRIRRRIFEIVRTYRLAAGKPMPYDMSITVFDAKVAEEDFSALKARIERLLENISRV